MIYWGLIRQMQCRWVLNCSVGTWFSSFCMSLCRWISIIKRNGIQIPFLNFESIILGFLKLPKLPKKHVLTKLSSLTKRNYDSTNHYLSQYPNIKLRSLILNVTFWISITNWILFQTVKNSSMWKFRFCYFR
jgi:hypothetical protein